MLIISKYYYLRIAILSCDVSLLQCQSLLLKMIALQSRHSKRWCEKNYDYL